MKYEVQSGENTRSVQVQQAPNGGWLVAIDGTEPVHITGGAVGRAEWVLRVGERAHRLAMAVKEGVAHIQHDGSAYQLEVIDPRRAALAMAGRAEEGAVSTQMPGVVVRVLVKEGQAVTKGTPLVVVEAMKMENEFNAPCDGVVESVSVRDGQPVEAGTLLVTVHPGAEA